MKNLYETLSKNDECYTPAYVVEAILPYLEKFKGKIIWCPFDKQESEYVKILIANGHNVIFGHKDEDKNFYDAGNGLFAIDLPEFDLIISNPPFTNKAKTVERILSFGKPFALLLPLTWLNDSAPNDLFCNQDLELLIFKKRPQFKNCGKQPSFKASYFCSGILPRQIILLKT